MGKIIENGKGKIEGVKLRVICTPGGLTCGAGGGVKPKTKKPNRQPILTIPGQVIYLNNGIIL